MLGSVKTRWRTTLYWCLDEPSLCSEHAVTCASTKPASIHESKISTQRKCDERERLWKPPTVSAICATFHEGVAISPEGLCYSIASSATCPVAIFNWRESWYLCCRGVSVGWLIMTRPLSLRFPLKCVTLTTGCPRTTLLDSKDQQLCTVVWTFSTKFFPWCRRRSAVHQLRTSTCAKLQHKPQKMLGWCGVYRSWPSG